MNNFRVIPVLLLHQGALYKSVKFKNYKYVGDPINAVKIFNEKAVDEIVLLDIDATKLNIGPNFTKLEMIASEAFFPMAYGGGISTMEQIERLFYIGFEKIVLNYSLFINPNLIKEAVKSFGSQSIVASIDAKKNFFGKYSLYASNGKKKMKSIVVESVKEIQELGAGEIIINSIDKDGTLAGFDLNLIKLVASSVTIPVIACGGARNFDDFNNAIANGAAACAAGSMFVFQGKYKAVLISYPKVNN